MFTTRPSPGRIDPSLAMFDRLVGNLIHRAPFDVPGYGRPMSLAHASGTTGSTTIFVSGGTLAAIHARAGVRGSGRGRTRPSWVGERTPRAAIHARARLRVSGRDRTRPSWIA